VDLWLMLQKMLGSGFTKDGGVAFKLFRNLGKGCERLVVRGNGREMGCLGTEIDSGTWNLAVFFHQMSSHIGGITVRILGEDTNCFTNRVGFYIADVNGKDVMGVWVVWMYKDG
jgi:hypothetical protein